MQTSFHILYLYSLFCMLWVKNIAMAGHNPDPLERNIMESLGYSWDTRSGDGYWQKGEIAGNTFTVTAWTGKIPDTGGSKVPVMQHIWDQKISEINKPYNIGYDDNDLDDFRSVPEEEKNVHRKFHDEMIKYFSDEEKRFEEKKKSITDDLATVESRYDGNHGKLSVVDKAKHQFIISKIKFSKEKTELLFNEAKKERVFKERTKLFNEDYYLIMASKPQSNPKRKAIRQQMAQKSDEMNSIGKKIDQLKSNIAQLDAEIRRKESEITQLSEAEARKQAAEAEARKQAAEAETRKQAAEAEVKKKTAELTSKAGVLPAPVYNSDMVKAANVALRAPGTLALNRQPGKMQMAVAGAGVLTAPEATLGSIGKGFAELSRVVTVSSLGATVGAVVLGLLWPNEISSKSDKVPGRDLPAIFSYPVNAVLGKDEALQPGTKTVDLPVRGALVMDNGHLALELLKTGDSVPKTVPVLNAARDKATGLDRVTVPAVAGAPSRTILINPAPVGPTAPSNTGNTDPVPVTPTHTGTEVKPVSNIVTTTTPLNDVTLQDFIIWLPDAIGTGVEPLHVVLSSPRDLSGTVSGKGETVGEGWLYQADQDLGAPIPRQIADKLRGQTFANFGEFRKAFWQEAAKDPDLSKQFDPSNRKTMLDGYAPYPIPSQKVGGRDKFELHHVHAIQDYGAVYDLDNIRVMTPKRHIEIHSKNGGS